MRVALEKIDAWFCKGFQGITTLLLSRSKSKISQNNLKLLKKAIANLRLSTELGFNDPKDDLADDHMFPMLLQLSTMLLTRVRSDESLDRASVVAVKGHIEHLEIALKRFEEFELGSSSAECMERDNYT